MAFKSSCGAWKKKPEWGIACKSYYSFLAYACGNHSWHLRFSTPPATITDSLCSALGLVCNTSSPVCEWKQSPPPKENGKLYDRRHFVLLSWTARVFRSPSGLCGQSKGLDPGWVENPWAAQSPLLKDPGNLGGLILPQMPQLDAGS